MSNRLQEYWRARSIFYPVLTDAERLERMKADREALDQDIRALERKLYIEGEMATANSTEPED